MTFDQVFLGKQLWSADRADALTFLRALPDASASLVFFSPPYENSRTYGTDFRLKGESWVAWMRPIVLECARVCRGLVCVNMASKVDNCSYTAAVEWLVSDLTRGGGLVCGPSPYAWVKSEDHEDALGNGTPGSGGPYYHRRDWEPVYSFCLPNRLPNKTGDWFSNNLAFGKGPEFGPGGEFSNRDQDGTRANARKRRNPPGYARKANGGRNGGGYAPSGTDDGGLITRKRYRPPPISNPGNVLRVPVGGNKLGCPISHEGEAPMALGVAERFVAWYCRPGGIVLDPFCGSGTTAHAAVAHGRRFIGCDNRASQIKLTAKRMRLVTPYVHPR